MEGKIASNPFTPKSGWEPRVFVGREKQIKSFEEIIKKDRLDHFLVLGDWGIGKTSLLKEFKRAAQKEGILTSLVSVSPFEKLATSLDAVKHLVHMIPQESPLGINKFKKFSKQLNSFGVQILGSGVQLSWRSLDTDPQALLQNMLLALWEDIKNQGKFIILLDDVQNFKNTSSILTILKNVLSNEKLQETGLLFGLSCTFDGWKQFMQLHHPIGRYFTPRLKLDRLNKKETFEAVNWLLKDTGVSFEHIIYEKVYEYTLGHPYELQIICSKLYQNQIDGEVTQKVWESSFNGALLELGEVVFEGLYRVASANERKVLYMLAQAGKEISPQELADIIRNKGLKLSYPVVKTALRRLNMKNLVVQPDRFVYVLSDRMFKEYILRIKWEIQE